MKKKHLLGLASFLFLFLLVVTTLYLFHYSPSEHRGLKGNAQTNGNTYYVSKNGSNKDGISWATAWNELDQINWSVIQPGDIIILDGGSSQMVYTTTLTIGKSGTQSLPITIQRSTENGHNGKVVMFGGRSTPLPYCGQSSYTYQQSSVAHGIVFRSSSWIVIDGMNWDGISIYGHSSHGVDMTSNPSNDTLRNMEIYDNGTASQSGGTWNPDTNGHGIYLNGTNLTFEKMNIHDNSDDEFDTGIGSINNVTISYSWLHVDREDPTQPGLPFNQCVHQDGYQIYSGGTQGGILIENSIIGSGLKEGTILGNLYNSQGVGATVNNVTIRNSLFLNKVNDIMGYPQIKERNWTIDHVTVWNLNTPQQGAYPHSIFLEGSGHTVTNSIFYGGPFYLPDGLAVSSGNCQWNTTGNTSAIVGQTVDPQFVTDVSGFSDATPLAQIDGADFALRPGSPCTGKGSNVTSVAQFLSTVNGTTPDGLDTFFKSYRIPTVPSHESYCSTMVRSLRSRVVLTVPDSFTRGVRSPIFHRCLNLICTRPRYTQT